MAGHSIQLPPEYGYVVLAVVSTVILNLWMMSKVGKARKKYEVKYPTMYSDKHDTFNCIQRVHQNTLENIPVILVLLLLGGLQYPRLAAGGGFVWVISRVLYAKGYYTGDPQKRVPGAAGGMLSFLWLLLCTLAFAIRLLGWL